MQHAAALCPIPCLCHRPTSPLTFLRLAHSTVSYLISKTLTACMHELFVYNRPKCSEHLRFLKPRQLSANTPLTKDASPSPAAHSATLQLHRQRHGLSHTSSISNSHYGHQEAHMHIKKGSTPTQALCAQISSIICTLMHPGCTLQSRPFQNCPNPPGKTLANLLGHTHPSFCDAPTQSRSFPIHIQTSCAPPKPAWLPKHLPISHFPSCDLITVYSASMMGPSCCPRLSAEYPFDPDPPAAPPPYCFSRMFRNMSAKGLRARACASASSCARCAAFCWAD